MVDNNSIDHSPKMIKTDFPQLKLIENGENFGYSRANNQAIRISRSQYVLLLNPDALLSPGTLDAMIEFMDSHPEAGAVGPQLLNPDGSLQPSGNKFPTLGRVFREMLLHLLPQLTKLATKLVPKQYILKQPDFNHTCEVDEISGACLMTRSRVIDQVGLLDESFFAYYEDVDLCYRIKQASWKVLYFPQAKATHNWRRSSEQVGTRAALEHYKSRYLFFQKHYGKMSLLALKAITISFLLMDTSRGWMRCVAGSRAKREIRKSMDQNWQVIRMTF